MSDSRITGLQCTTTEDDFIMKKHKQMLWTGVAPATRLSLHSCSLFATLYSVVKVMMRGVSPNTLLVESVVSARQSDAKDNDLLQAST